MRAYVFVDAENHFIRSSRVLADQFGSEVAAQAMASAALRIYPQAGGFPASINGSRFGWNADAQFFWDCRVLSNGGTLSSLRPSIDRAIHACSATGSTDQIHEIRTTIRDFGFEPIVVQETKDIQRRRMNQLEENQLIEKAKGCDIALATRMVADAAADLYDCCLLFTSDADFLPAVEAIRRMGKVVWVFGYRSALAKKSPYLHIPDRFVDLSLFYSSFRQEDRQAISKATQSLGENANE